MTQTKCETKIIDRNHKPTRAKIRAETKSEIFCWFAIMTGSLPNFHCFISYFKVLLCKRKGNQYPILAKIHLTTYRTGIYCIALNLRFIFLTVLSLSLFPDIDECSLNTHDCDSRSERRTCTNTPGSFTCGCQSGYQLAPNKKTCNGEGVGT